MSAAKTFPIPAATKVSQSRADAVKSLSDTDFKHRIDSRGDLIEELIGLEGILQVLDLAHEDEPIGQLVGDDIRHKLIRAAAMLCTSAKNRSLQLV